MTQLAVNQFWRTQFAAMHETAERAVNAARRLGDAGLTAAALARLALAASMMGAAERADAHRSEAVALFESLSDDELARSIDAGALLSGMELYLDRYADGDAHATRTPAVARYRSGGAFPGPDPDPGRCGASAASWPRRPSCSTGIEAARLLGNTHALVWSLSGRSSAALRTGRWSPHSPPLRRASTSQDLSEGFHTAEAAADLAAALLETGQPERAVELLLGLRRRGGAGAHRGESEGSLPRGACAQLARAGPPRRGKTCRRVRRRLGLGRSAPDGCRLGRSSGGGRRSARRRPRRAAEQALTSAAAADQVGAPVEAALRACSRVARWPRPVRTIVQSPS